MDGDLFIFYFLNIAVGSKYCRLKPTVSRSVLTYSSYIQYVQVVEDHVCTVCIIAALVAKQRKLKRPQ